MYSNKPDRHQICEFEHNKLLYRAYLYRSGEVLFSVTGDEERLGLIDNSDPLWQDFSPPEVVEVTHLTGNIKNPVSVIRKIAKHTVQYIKKYKPRCVYYRIIDDYRRHKLYMHIFNRYPELASLYTVQADQISGYVILSRNENLD